MANVLGLDRDFLIEALRNFTLKITFTKTDGSVREMTCTRNPKLVVDQQGSGVTVGMNLDVIPVWDLEKRGWRSFRVDSLLTAEFVRWLLPISNTNIVDDFVDITTVSS